MAKMNFPRYLDQIPQNATILVDLDNTLVFTNRANNLAYEKALCDQAMCYSVEQSGLGRDIYFSIREKLPSSEARITKRELLTAYLERKKQSDRKQIKTERKIILSAIKQKKEIYSQFIFSTELNMVLLNYLKKSNHQIILVTKCSRRRAEEMLSYYQLSELFEEKIYCDRKTDKYPYAINYLNQYTNLLSGYRLGEVYIIDDDLEELSKAITYGILRQNIFCYHIRSEKC